MHTTDRRKFIKTSAGIAAGTTLASNISAQASKTHPQELQDSKRPNQTVGHGLVLQTHGDTRPSKSL